MRTPDEIKIRANEPEIIESADRLWVVDQQRSHDHWLEVREPDGWYAAVVKFDGCIDLRRYLNDPLAADRGQDDYQGADWQEDSIHICDVDDMISRLQSLKAEALKHFGPDWNT